MKQRICPASPRWKEGRKGTLAPLDPQAMVDWYHPRQLAATAVRVVVSGLFGEYADRRFLEAMGDTDGQDPEIFDYSERKSMTLDYLSDTGDGWDSTYAMARLLAQPELRVEGHPEPLPRGEVLVLGGDEVYPTPARGEYERRLVAPFETAKAWSDPAGPVPELFALPGNHDWYDGLASFWRLFVTKGWLGGWRLRQRRSYFALKLPHRWWLVATDMQLASDLDEGQVKYFERVASFMGPEDKVILCAAEPHWIYAHERARGHWDRPERPRVQENCSEPPASNLDFLEDHVFQGARIQVMVAGDLHHYRRHAHADGRQKITAGGGGAFLHPTHPWGREPLAGDFALKAAWPPEGTSRRLAWRNLFFPFKHPKFGALTGALYLMLAWSVMVNVGDEGLGEWREAAALAFQGMLASPAATFLVTGLLGGFVLFADPARWRFRLPAGLLHGAAHLILCFLLGWGVTAATTHGLPALGIPAMAFGTAPQMVVSGLLILLGGWLLGPVLLGFYLLAASYLGRHWNESFSSLAIPDWKHFLRLRIAEDGSLTIFPIGLRRVPRRWKAGSHDAEAPRLDPDDPRATAPELLEDPIRLGGTP